MKNETQQHNKNSKQMLYAGLATVTLVGGMGATPVVLAEELLVDQTEIVDKNDKRDKNDQSDENREGEATSLVVEKPAPLPEVDLSPVVAPELSPESEAFANTNLNAEVAAKAATAKIAAEAIKRAQQNKAAKPKAQSPRVDLTNYAFGVDDFVIVDGTITDLTDHFRAVVNSPDWDKVIRFTPELGAVVTAIGEGAFCEPVPGMDITYTTFGMYPTEEIDFTNLVNLETIGKDAFYGSSLLQRITLNKSLVTIGENAFGWNYGLTDVDFTNLPNLVLIDFVAFAGCPLNEIDLSGDNKLETIGHSAFWHPNITELNLHDLPALKRIGSGAFTWAEKLTKISLTGLPALEYIDTLAFQMADLLPGYPLLSKLQEITIGDINPDVRFRNLIFNVVLPGGRVIPTNQASLAVAQRLVDVINSNEILLKCGCYYGDSECTCGDDECVCGAENLNNFTGDDAWYITATATQKYIDEAGKEITQDINGNAITPPKTNGKIGEQYALADAPVIPGYDAPELVAGTNVGTYDELWEEATYKYTRTKAAKFTVYYVDENDQEIAPKQELEDVPEAEFALTPQAITGYDFKELFGTKVEASRAVTDFNWEATHELINQKVKFGDNNGRSYKFVYNKQAATPEDTTKPDGGTNTNKPVNTPPTKPATTTDTTPNNQPTETDKNPGKTPGNLPSSGGEKTPAKQDTKQPASGGNTTANQTVTTNKAKDSVLPKSGNAKNVVLSVLGATVLAGMLGLYVFTKKRKS